MKFSILLALGLAFTLPLHAQETKPAEPAKPAEEAKPGKAAKGPSTPEKSFTRKDKDNDGFLSQEEFVGKATDAAKTKAQAGFAQKDKDANGKLSLEEFAAKPAPKAPKGGKGGRKKK
jgi:hypothetical protein